MQRDEESINLLLPGPGRRIVPDAFALRERQRPVEQVAEVGKNLERRARGAAGSKGRELADRMRISRVDVLKRSLAVYAALENSTPEQGATVSFARVGGELAIPGFTWDWRRDETHA